MELSYFLNQGYYSRRGDAVNSSKLKHKKERLYMKEEQGNLSIDSENIFPIIKKWLYSDHDIFVRELVSNGCDAITKRKKLDVIGEAALPDDYKAKDYGYGKS